MKAGSKTNTSPATKVLALAGIGILVTAYIFGVWWFFGRSKPSADSVTLNQNRHEIIKNSTMAPNTDTAGQEMSEASSNAKLNVPAALVDAGEFGENIYDAAKADDWKTAEVTLSDLKASVKKLNSEKIGSEKLDSTLAGLEKSVASKDKNATLELSNLFTLDAANLTVKFNPRIPVEITKLDYYGRELEIGAETKDEAKLKATAREIRSTWEAVKARVEANNGMNQAAVFEDLVRNTEAAKSISDYSILATPILDEVDNLEDVFK